MGWAWKMISSRTASTGGVSTVTTRATWFTTSSGQPSSTHTAMCSQRESASPGRPETPPDEAEAALEEADRSAHDDTSKPIKLTNNNHNNKHQPRLIKTSHYYPHLTREEEIDIEFYRGRNQFNITPCTDKNGTIKLVEQHNDEYEEDDTAVVCDEYSDNSLLPLD